MELPASPDTGRTARPAPWLPCDDAPLVRAAQQGDRAAFDALYRRHARAVRAVLLGRVGREDVDDLVQEAFLAAWRQVGTLRDAVAFGAWMLAIARHLRIDHARRQRPHAALDDPRTTTRADRALAAGSLDEEASARHRLDAERALATVAALPEAYRTTLLLRLVEGMTGPEIAARTGLTPDSVRVNLCRGFKLLRDTLTREQDRALALAAAHGNQRASAAAPPSGTGAAAVREPVRDP